LAEPSTSVDATEREASESRLMVYLVADIRGYTAFTQREGNERAAALVRSVFSAAEKVAGEYGANVEGTAGDSVLLSFGSGVAAVTAAVALRDRLNEARSDLPGPRVGIGLSAGDDVRTSDGLNGDAVNRAARIMADAEEGQVLVDESVKSAAGVVGNVEYRALGERQYKNIEGVVSVFELNAPENALVGVGQLLPSAALKPEPGSQPLSDELVSWVTDGVKRALLQIPDEFRRPAVFRWLVCWPEVPLQEPLGLGLLKGAVGLVSGGRHQSVFAVLRYHDWARWDDRRAVVERAATNTTGIFPCTFTGS
jgi:class 3 adenylate cyclase